MSKRRFAYLSSSDEEDDDIPTPSMVASRPFTTPSKDKKQEEIKLREEEEKTQSKAERTEKGRCEEEEESEEEDEGDPVPIGEVVKVSGKGRDQINHYMAFEYAGNLYELENPVLFAPNEEDGKPYVGIIKDITQPKDGDMMVTGQWLYRPEEAVKKGGGTCQSDDARELFYSIHLDDVPASSVMHKCVLHFVPNHKQWPNQKQHPGFIVQKFYDYEEHQLWKISHKDYKDSIQREIDILLQKTRSRLGDLPDIETKHAAAAQNDQLKCEIPLRKRPASPVTTDDEVTNLSEYRFILSNAKVLTGKAHRDKWLERLLEGVQKTCSNPHRVKKGLGNSDVNQAQERSANSCKSFQWPESAVSAVTALEKVANDALSSDFQKYNQKLRQLVFNLKNSELLALRLLNGELKPCRIIYMSPNELKEGLTAAEMPRKEPEYPAEPMQMTGDQCSRCNEYKAFVKDIIVAGGGDRYQLECMNCGNSWYAVRNWVSRR